MTHLLLPENPDQGDPPILRSPVHPTNGLHLAAPLPLGVRRAKVEQSVVRSMSLWMLNLT